MTKLPKQYEKYLPYLHAIKNNQIYINFKEAFGVNMPAVKTFNGKFQIPKDIVSKYDLEIYLWDNSIRTYHESFYLDLKFEDLNQGQMFQVAFTELDDTLTLLYFQVKDKILLTLAIESELWINRLEELHAKAVELKPEIDKYLEK